VIVTAVEEAVDDAAQIHPRRASGVAIQSEHADEHEGVRVAQSTARRRSIALSSERPVSRASCIEPDTLRRQPTTVAGDRSDIASTEEVGRISGRDGLEV
jgi:hypothetical protein